MVQRLVPSRCLYPDGNRTREQECLEEPSLGLFQRQWKLYRKVVDNNYLFHREAYAQLHRILVDEAGREAGFTRVRQLFVAPSNLFRMYCFQT